jgi:hypothetical protein
MTAAIRILRAPHPSIANIEAIEHEEQLLAVARRVVEAGGNPTPELVNACAAKFRALREKNNPIAIEHVAHNVSKQMRTAKGSAAIIAHADMDFERLMELLEG